MPYHVHARDQDPTTGREYSTASEAGQSKQDGETVTFLASTDEINAWRDREYTRKSNGEYQDVPWRHLIEDRFPDHYLHLSLTQPGKLAYTKSVQHGIEDRQTIVRPGKYLREYYNDLHGDQIEQYAAMVTAESTALKIARTPDDILTAYTADLGSCMRKGKNILAGLPQHPVRAYGDSDLAVAYTGPIENVDARCIVWPERMIFNRPYGHTSMLEALLRSNGYRQGSIKGARIQAIEYRHGWIVPYVDGVSNGSLSDCGKWIELDDCGPIDLHNTTGIAQDESSTCSHCNEACDPDEGLCSYCQENTSCCDDCNDRFSDDDMYFEDGTGYCQRCHSRRFSSCHACDETIPAETACSYDGDDYCQDCYSDRFSTCEACDDTVPCDDIRSSEASGEYYCDSCWHDHNRTCAMVDCETEWNELDVFTSRQRTDRKRNRTDDICEACADRFCHTCESTHDPDDCQVIADAESDGFGVCHYDPAGTPWQRTLDFGALVDVHAAPGPVPEPVGGFSYTGPWYGGTDFGRSYQSHLLVLDVPVVRSWRTILAPDTYARISEME